MICIAIDGPSGSGKSTVSKMIADNLGFIDVNTGALYRAIAYYLKINNIDYKDVNKVCEVLNLIDIKIYGSNEKIFLNGKDISSQIRSEDISRISSKISSYPKVREYLLETQRKIAKNNNVVMDGRDIGTVVIPHADVKIFLTALPEIRAKRRYNQLKEEQIKFKKLLEDLNKRDYEDIHRKISPLKIADDAIIFDNSKYTVEETVNKLLSIIKEYVKFK